MQVDFKHITTSLIDGLILKKKDIKKATKHYFIVRKNTQKYSCIDTLAQDWDIELFESFAYIMLYRTFLRCGGPITLSMLCKQLLIKKQKHVTYLRLLLYLRFAENRGLIRKIYPSNGKLSQIKYIMI